MVLSEEQGAEVLAVMEVRLQPSVEHAYVLILKLVDAALSIFSKVVTNGISGFVIGNS